MRKLRVTGEPIAIEPHLESLRTYLGSVPGLAAVFLFGSYGTPAQTPLSDIDLALVFRRGSEPSRRKEAEITGEVLARLQEDDVSLTFLNRMPSASRFEVLTTGRRLLCRDEEALADFVEETLRVHGDYILDYEPFLREYDEALIERSLSRRPS